MRELASMLGLWLADYYLVATILLAAAVIAGSAVREPVKRVTIAWGACIGLAVLTLLCAAPFWPRVALRHSQPRVVSTLQASSVPPGVPETGQRNVLPLPPAITRQEAAAVATRDLVEVRPAAEAPLERSKAFEIDPLAVLVGAFAVGAAAMIAWLALGAIQARWLCRKAIVAPEPLRCELQAIAGALRKLPRLLISGLVRTAAAMGLVRPTILLPAGASEGESAASNGSKRASLRMLLAHEYAHIARRDLWLLALCRLLLVVLYPHPLYWWLRRRIRADQEFIADAWAAAACGRHQYAENLVQWAREQPPSRPTIAAALGIWERPGQLSRRIAALLNEQLRLQLTCPRRWRLTAAALITMSVVALSLITLRPAPIAKAEQPAAEPNAKTKDHLEGGKADVSQTTATEALPSLKPLPEKIAVTGICLDDNRKPVADALVRLYLVDHVILRPADSSNTTMADFQIDRVEKLQHELRQTRTNTEGKFEFADLATDVFETNRDRSFQLSAQKPGRASDIAVYVPYGAPHKLPLRFLLPPAATVKGRVTDADGRPLKGANAYSPVSWINEPGPLPGIHNATTDADGRFEINDVRAASAGAMIQHRDFAPKNSGPPSPTGEYIVALEKPVVLEGQVLWDDDRSPAENICLTFQPEEAWGRWMFVWTNREGRFRIATLPTGEYSLFASDHDYGISGDNFVVKLPPGEHHIDLRLDHNFVVRRHEFKTVSEEKPKVQDAPSKQSDEASGAAQPAGQPTPEVKQDKAEDQVEKFLAAIEFRKDANGRYPAKALENLRSEITRYVNENPKWNDAAAARTWLLRTSRRESWTKDELLPLLTEAAGWSPSMLVIGEFRERDARVEETFKLGRDCTPEELSKFEFGPAKDNGLRIARTYEPTKSTYHVGDVLKCRVIFYNSGTKPVQFSTELWPQDGTWSIQNANGQTVRPQTMWYTGWPSFARFLLEPGKIAEINAPSIAIGEKPQTNNTGSAVGVTIPAQPGDELRVLWTMRLADSMYRHGDGTVGLPRPGDWTGELQTGEVKFQIVAADAPNTKAAAPDEPAKIDPTVKPDKQRTLLAADDPERNETYKDFDIDIFVDPKRDRQAQTLPANLQAELSKLDGVEQVAAYFMDLVSFEKYKLFGCQVNGWPPDSPLCKQIEVLEGRRLRSDDKEKVMLGRLIAKTLEKKVGDTLDLYGNRFEVVGIFRSPVDLNDRGLIFTLDELQRQMNRPNAVSGFTITAKKPIDDAGLADLCKRIEALRPYIKATNPKPFVKVEEPNSPGPSQGKSTDKQPEKPTDKAAIALPDKTTISGTCIDENKKPLADARVRLFLMDWSAVENGIVPESAQRELQQTRADAGGRFHFDDVSTKNLTPHDSTFFIVGQLSGRGTAVESFTLADLQAGIVKHQELTLRLPPGGLLKGRVTNAQHQPVANAVVFLPSVLPKPVPGIEAAVTDTDGRYEISDLQQVDLEKQEPQRAADGTTSKTTALFASVRHPDYAPQNFLFTKVPDTVDVAIDRVAVVQGRVSLAENNQPARNAQLHFYSDMTGNGDWTRTKTDEQGRYRLATLPPGDYRLIATMPDRAKLIRPGVHLQAGENTIDASMPRGGIIRGRIVDAATRKQISFPNTDKFYIGVSDKQSNSVVVAMQRPQVSTDGTFELIVPAGQNYLDFHLGVEWQVINPDRLWQTGVEVAEGETRDLEIKVKPTVPGLSKPLPKEPEKESPKKQPEESTEKDASPVSAPGVEKPSPPEVAPASESTREKSQLDGPARTVATKGTAGTSIAQPEYRFKVIDLKKKPIGGAKVQVWACSIAGSGGSGSLDEKWVPASTTDESGNVKIVLPTIGDGPQNLVLRKLASLGIERLALKIEHPEHPTWSEYINVPTDEPIVLQDPVTIEIRAHRASENAELDRLYPAINAVAVDWSQSNGLLTVCRVDLAGKQSSRWLRVVHVSATGPAWFSELFDLKQQYGNPISIDAALKPGVRVEGRLSDRVPRPVKNGRIVAAIVTGSDPWSNWYWEAAAEIAADGSFVIESLPADENLQLIALCDGWVSSNPTAANVKDYSKQYNFGDLGDPGFNTTVCPQLFRLEAPVIKPTVLMQPTGACEVKVVDEHDQPIPGATVAFSPNQVFYHSGSNVVGEGSDILTRIRAELASGKHNQSMPASQRAAAFTATTDDRGIAVVHELPAGREEKGTGSHDDMFFVQRDNYVTTGNLPSPEYELIGAPLFAQLEPGETTHVTARMHKASQPKAGSPEPADDELAGRVVDESGRPIEDVKVLVWERDDEKIRTDKDGYFRYKTETHNGDEKHLLVRFIKPGYAPNLIVDWRLGLKNQTVVLDNKTYFEGIVQRPDGKPAANVLIRANQGPKQENPQAFIGEIWSETTTDAAGHYKLLVQPDTYAIEIRAPGIGTARVPKDAEKSDSAAADATLLPQPQRPKIAIAANEAKHLDIKLDPGIDFSARLVDSITGKPVPNVRLWHWQHPGVEGRTNDEGLVTIPTMPPGEFTFMIEAPAGYVRGWSEDIPERWKKLAAESRRDGLSATTMPLDEGLSFDLAPAMQPVTISLQPGVTISGRVLDPDGKPVAGATVAPVRSGKGVALTGDTRFSVESSKEDGSFSVVLPPIQGAKYNLMVHDGQYQKWRTWANGVGSPLETKPGETLDNLELKLTRPGIIRGRTVDRQGQPIADVYVQTTAADRLENNYYNPATRSDKDGNFELRYVRPGRNLVHGWILVDDPDKEEIKFPNVDVRAGETTDAGDVVIPPRYQDRN